MKNLCAAAEGKVAKGNGPKEATQKRFKKRGINKNKRECYSRLPQLSDTRYSASENANAKFHNFSGNINV